MGEWMPVVKALPPVEAIRNSHYAVFKPSLTGVASAS
jgi:hypothetical protein